MPTSVQPDVSDLRVRRRLPFDPWVPITVLVALLLVAFLGSNLRTGPFVDHVAFSNSSDYAFEVAVSAAPGSSRTVLGNVAAKGTTTVANVFDEGSRWTFQFSTQGRFAGQVSVTRDDLVRDGWRVAIPDEFSQALASAGVVPTD